MAWRPGSINVRKHTKKLSKKEQWQNRMFWRGVFERCTRFVDGPSPHGFHILRMPMQYIKR